MTSHGSGGAGTWPFDPFSFKRWSKCNPRRVAFVVWSRFQEQWSRSRFDRFKIPLHSTNATETPLIYEQTDTAVTLEQAALLIAALHSTEHMIEPVVEVGCYRGVTTRSLANNTSRKFIAVDPFAGYGGAEEDLKVFRDRVENIPNLIHFRCTSGEAAQQLINERFSFVFIDAVHDYVNVRFDSIAWCSLLQKDGLIAFHDTDDRKFAGTRRAVFELMRRHLLGLEDHVENLAILRKLA
jgi:predicted O-methyltransferase YrrM